MDIDTPTTDIVITDEAVLVEGAQNNSFGKEIAKTLIISAATTAGMVAGTLAIGFTVGKFQALLDKRRASKSETVIEGEIDDTIETPKTEK